MPYKKGISNEPYYPLLNEESQQCYQEYSELAEKINNLFVCGRLGDFKYYNMDQALEKSLQVVEMIVNTAL